MFRGRQLIIDGIAGALAVVVNGARGGRDVRGLTQLVQGAPGAGKTALLDEIAKRFRTGETRRRICVPGRPVTDIPVPAAVRPEDLPDERRVVTAIVKALKEALLKETDFRRTKTSTGGFRAGPDFFRVSAGSGQYESPPEARFGVVRERLPPAGWPRPVCLMVDENQNVDPAAKGVPDKLHNDMRGLPVLTVLAGLGASDDRLSGSPGLARLASDAIHDIGCLEPEESQEVVLGTLEVFHVDITHPHADGWPQHLHNGMRGLADGLIEARARLAGVDAGPVPLREAEFRRTSYRRRVSPEMEGARCLTGAVMQDVAAGAERAAVRGSIDRHSVRTEESEPRLWRLPEGMTAPAFLGHLVHRGVLQQGDDRLFRCPIPSFSHYLIEQGRDPQSIVDERKYGRPGSASFDNVS